ncbi:histidine phosphotransferase family protein [Rhizomicrobium electricum]|jgi:histidine phosphotransferase ChpT|uniref:Histidine phosphotransferase family protein n=1 Tax=Rhizomicrobium electricum TaxID=480070 RepID=A0ABP3PL99_9PROT|nr:histidine phosphotransferase family protein [Rhizomicrobium electricum]NIJ47141.1 histidine phosphotransferase ChpT [Rhizomicrobium electricum]
MTDLEFSAFLVSRVCHDLVGPLGAVVNGLEVLEDERDAAMRADALKIVTSSAAQALARLQFMRLAFGAAGSAGAELPLGEVGTLIAGLMSVGRVTLEFDPPPVHWPKDWAKLLMNATLIGVDCLPRGGVVRIEANGFGQAPGFKVTATGTGARISEDVERALKGEICEHDARGVQPVLTFRLAKGVNAGLTITPREGAVELVAG